MIAVSLIHKLPKQPESLTRTLPLVPVKPKPLRAMTLMIVDPVPTVALPNSTLDKKGTLKLTPFVKFPTSRTTLTRRDCAEFLPLTDRQTTALSEIQELTGHELPDIRIEML